MSTNSNNVHWKSKRKSKYKDKNRYSAEESEISEEERNMGEISGEDNQSYITDDSITMPESEIIHINSSSDGEKEVKLNRNDGSKKFFFSPTQLKLQLEKRLTMCGYTTQLSRAIEDNDLLHFQQLLPQADNFEKEVALLRASLQGCSEMMSRLFEAGTNANIKDSSGRSAAHLASLKGNADCLQLLIKHGANANQWDDKNETTPLMCAASGKSVACVKLLLEAGAHIDAGLTSNNQTALLWAVRAGSVECARVLLENKAQVNSPTVFTRGPIHVAAAEGNNEMLKLLIEYKASTNLAGDKNKMTPLHLAAEDGEVECVRLLLEAGANVKDMTIRNQTALHLAAIAQSSECVNLILSARGSDVNAQDSFNRTPLHRAIGKNTRNLECVKVLLDRRADPNKRDKAGFTPLHLAAFNENSNCVKLLMDKGADMTIKNNAGITALNFIQRKTPSMIGHIRTIFDHAISFSDEANDKELQLKFDFKALVPGNDNSQKKCNPGYNSESNLLMTLILEGQKNLLKHPLCESFLHLKWEKTRSFFLFNMMWYFLFAIMLSIYTMTAFNNQCFRPRENCTNSSNDSEVECGDNQLLLGYAGYVSSYGMLVQFYLLLLMVVIMIVREVLEVIFYTKTYLYHKENYMQWAIILHVFLLIDWYPSDRCIKEWQYHVAAIGILLTWGEMMLMIGKLPMFGIYVQMFTHVSKDFAKFLFAYLSLLIAFCLCFSIIFPKEDSLYFLNNFGLRTLVMMAGEFEYVELFHEGEKPVLFSITTQILFVVFIVFVSIVLMNLLVGLAVSDIAGLKKNAGLEKITRQAELIHHIEGIMFCRIVDWLPRRVKKCVFNRILLVPSAYRWSFFIKPNNPRDKRIPRDILDAAIRIARQRRQARRRALHERHSIDEQGLDRNEDSFEGLVTTTYQMQAKISYLDRKIASLEDTISKHMTTIEELLKKD